MELIVIALLIGYAIVKDILFYKEREKLQMKLMSKDLNDYVSTIAPEDENAVQEEDPYIPVEDATVEQILKAKDVI
jgi:hypothetical protein